MLQDDIRIDAEPGKPPLARMTGRAFVPSTRPPHPTLHKPALAIALFTSVDQITHMF